MAVVYLGERDDQHFRKQVAIKMLRPGSSTAEIVDRFRNERQTLAALDHPNIVKLLDGGATETGRPYFVMEYVSGVRIDAIAWITGWISTAVSISFRGSAMRSRFCPADPSSSYALRLWPLRSTRYPSRARPARLPEVQPAEFPGRTEWALQ